MTFSTNPTWETQKKNTRFNQSSILKLSAPPLYTLIILFCCIQSSLLSAATFELEDSILDSSNHAVLQTERVSQISHKQTTDSDFSKKRKKSASDESSKIKENDTSASTFKNTLTPSGDSLDNPFQPAALSHLKPLDASASVDIYRLTFNKLGTIVDEEALTDAALRLKDFNVKLNDLNESIEDQMEPALQRLMGNTGSDVILDEKKSNRLDIKAQSLELVTSGESSTIASEEMPTGIMGFLLQLPHYLFNVKNLLILLVCILILSLILKALHFILNRIY